MQIRALVMIGVMACVSAACNGKSPSPTAPTSSAPPPAVTAAPPPAVPATPYSGVWEGRYRIERCDGTGSIQDLLCSPQRGIYPPGTTLPLRIDLTQTGSTVTGRIELGAVTGVVSGVVRSNGLLTLSGTARGGTTTAEITYWDTRAIGNAMDGYFTFNATYTNIPGVAVVVTTLQSVFKR
ncbi:MAG: hypothetical protein Q8L86_11320 [Vicinamibacterales bacterium]|nr:hypothetical protein [Vicinamibacterales bacterium]